ncbi:MAG: TonB-dependent receptor [Flavobacteriaceae bacterium]|nr:TonB-dependent receptor [Flavobacteriaceae bacterium]
MKKYISFLLFFVTTVFFAQTGTIQGVVLDKESGNEPLPFANVYIKDSQTGTSTDLDGIYLFKAQPGTYTLVFTFVGYQKIEVPNIIVKAGEVTTLENVIMGATEGVSLNEVIVKATTQKESVAALLTEQKKAVEIKTAIGAEELSAKGISDAASAVTKISGVSKQEGSSNVYVRGLGDRYLNTTFNGLSLPSNDINKKNIDLDLFSSDVIQNVSISKAYSTKFYGDFAAGNVDITSKEHTGSGFVDVYVNSGFNSNAIDKTFVKNSGTGFFGFYGRYEHNPFAVVLSHGVDPIESPMSPINLGIGLNAGTSLSVGDDSRLNMFLTASFDNNYEYRSGSAVDYTTVEKKNFPNIEEFEYGTTTTVMGTVSFKVDNINTFKYSSLFINKASDEVGYYGIKGLGTNRDARLNTDEGFYQMNSQFNQDLIFVNQLTGDHKLNDKLALDWGVGYNNVYSHEPDRKRISLENYHYALDNDPNTNPVFHTNLSFDNQRYFQNIEDEELNGRVNLAYSPSENIKFNFGYNGRTKERNFDNIRYGYKLVNPSFQVTDIHNFDAIFHVDNLSLDGETGLFQTDVFRAINPPQVGNINRPGLPENTYKGNLDIYAGYINAEINLNDKWLIVPGIRAESFSQSIAYNVINLPPSDPGYREAYENFYLPSLSIRYAINDNQNLRVAFSKTISFPEFKEMAPFVYEGVTQRIGGNPDLLNDPSFSEIFNYDIKYEWFISGTELFSLGAFAKQIHDPVNLVVANDATGTQRYFRTGDKATIYGAEFEARKHLLLNADDKPKLSAGVNFTYMHTEQDLKSSTGLYTSTFERDSDELQGASPIIVNADISYSPQFTNYKPVANVVFSYFSDRIHALGSGQLGNIIEKAIPSLDFIWKNNIGENFQINVSAKNLLDPSIEYIRENTSLGDVIISQYKKGINVGLQLKYTF